MGDQIGVAQEVLDAIELRLIGADFRPWALRKELCDEYGQPYICKASRKASIKAFETNKVWTHGPKNKVPKDQDDRIQPDMEEPDAVDRAGFVRSLALFRLCSNASHDMGEFVAHAPEDIETLLNEVKGLRARLRRVENEREEFRKDLLSARVEKASLQEKLTATKRTLREFAQLMKEQQP